jgi:pimeloyl-ACP methyl ester carboxylesterase
MNCVPLLPGYRWHRTARIWRTRGLGELSTRIWNRRLADLALRESRGDWSRHDPAFVDMIWNHLDRGTFEAILRLYRSADPERLEAAGARLGQIDAPALVVWALRDRYIPEGFGRAYAERLPNAELLELPRAGHWPWIDEPDVVDRVVAFLEDEDSGRP